MRSRRPRGRAAARLVGEIERAEARASRRATAARSRASAVSAVTAAHAPSSCSGRARRDERLERMHRKRRACGSSAASGVAPETCATHGPGSIAGATSAIARVGHAEQRELAVGRARDAALAQAGSDG